MFCEQGGKSEVRRVTRCLTTGEEKKHLKAAAAAAAAATCSVGGSALWATATKNVKKPPESNVLVM